MLLKITRKCSMGCTHCLEDATYDGKHMPMETFEKVLKFITYINPMVVIVTGGEPTEHPDFFEIMKKLIAVFGKDRILLTSNGMFLYNQVFTNKVLDLGVEIQVTNDIRYYPMAINMSLKHSLIKYETHIRTIFPQGRAVANGIKVHGVTAPKCFNIRSIALRNANTFKETVGLMEMKMKVCTPSIGIDGSLYLGESSLCNKVGNIEMTDKEIMNNIRKFKCNMCGMIDNLLPIYRDIINE